MSKREFSRLEVLLQVQSGRLRVADACVLIGLRRRQVFRLLHGLKQDGVTSLLSKRRGKPSNNRCPSEVRTLALSLIRERYSDFGPTLAAEKLTEHHGCTISRAVLIYGDGRPVCSEMWPGNTADVTALVPVIDRLHQRFPRGSTNCGVNSIASQTAQSKTGQRFCAANWCRKRTSTRFSLGGKSEWSRTTSPCTTTA
jgi:hypothetical protein